MPFASILDPVQPTLPPLIWDEPGSPEPKLKPRIAHWITRHVFSVLESGGYDHPERWCHLYLTGSLTTFQYGDDSDCDISLFIDSQSLPEWSRAEMIGLMVSHADGITIPGTPYVTQNYVVPAGIKPHDLYRHGLRSGYDIKSGKWIEPPDHARVHDVEREENGFYTWALEQADKMESLLKYEPEKAEQLWHQIHIRRQRDQALGKGDNSESNIVYKFLSQRGLFPKLEQLTGEHIASADTQAMLNANAGQDLAGLPTQANVPGYGPLEFHSNGDIQRIANEYNQANGLGQHPTDYTPINPEISAQIAQAFDQMQHNPNDPQVREAYEALKREVGAQYQHAVNNGYRFEFYPEDHDPYPNSPREAVMDLHRNKHMYVYPTENGFGQHETSDHPLLEHTGETWNGKPVTYNDAFRAIHDFYGHAKEGLGFRASGEDNAYRQHAAMFTPLARQALAAETRGQNSWVNYGPNGATNRIAGQGDTIYADQKAGLLPEWATDPNLHQSQSQTQQVFAKWSFEDQPAPIGPPVPVTPTDDQGYELFRHQIRREWAQRAEDKLQQMGVDNLPHYYNWLETQYQDQPASIDGPPQLSPPEQYLRSRTAETIPVARPIRPDELSSPTAIERGHSRPVSEQEWNQIADRGRQLYEQSATHADGTQGLDTNWDALKSRAWQKVQVPWEGDTINAATGEPIEGSPDVYALTVKPPGYETVSIPVGSTFDHFSAAMDAARQRFDPLLRKAGHHLGIFRDEDLGRVDFDPVLVTPSRDEAEAIGAYTRNVGGAYHFGSGDGFWPPHVPEETSHLSSWPTPYLNYSHFRSVNRTELPDLWEPQESAEIRSQNPASFEPPDEGWAF